MIHWGNVAGGIISVLGAGIIVWLFNTIARLNRVITNFESDQKDMTEVKANINALANTVSHLASEVAELRGAFNMSVKNKS